jgi:hypothetical protein
MLTVRVTMSSDPVLDSMTLVRATVGDIVHFRILLMKLRSLAAKSGNDPR